MDPIKIGQYIAGKRKELGLTQRQVAEKLGMSDKSVSKWERGICLPDVSVYQDLCMILGITINEFLAGEDIPTESIAVKADENIIGVATDSKKKQIRLKWIIALLLVVSLAAALVIGAILLRREGPKNFIAPVDRESVEMKTAELLSGMDGAHMYRFTTTDEYHSLKVFISKYQSGKLIYKEDVEIGFEGIGSPEQGTIVLVPDFENFLVKLIIANDSSKLSTEIPILEDVPEREYYGRSATEIPGETPIRYDEEQGLLALLYGKNELRVLSLQDLMDGETDSLAVNDYVYYFSVLYEK